LTLGVSSNAKFFFFFSRNGGSKMAFVRVFFLLGFGIFKKTILQYSSMTHIINRCVNLFAILRIKYQLQKLQHQMTICLSQSLMEKTLLKVLPKQKKIEKWTCNR